MNKLIAALCGVLALFVMGAATGRKISDYRETLSITDAWIYEIAVPGVTNYKVTFGTIATNIIARVPVGGGGGSVVTNANQFGASSMLTLKSGLLATNPVLYGNIGVGTNLPKSALHVLGSTTIDPVVGDSAILGRYASNSIYRIFSVSNSAAARGPYVMDFSDPLFNGERNSAAGWGYNQEVGGGLINTNEPGLRYNIEGNYNDSTGTNKMETYIQFVSTTNRSTRPYFVSMNRATHKTDLFNIKADVISFYPDDYTEPTTPNVRIQKNAMSLNALNAAHNELFINSATGFAGILYLGYNTAPGILQLFPTSTNSSSFQLNSREVIRMYSSPIGQPGSAVAIGVDDSGAALTVENSGHASLKGMVVRGKATQTGNIFEIQNSGSTALVSTTAAGKLGIATNLPQTALHVRGNTTIDPTPGDAAILGRYASNSSYKFYSVSNTASARGPFVVEFSDPIFNGERNSIYSDGYNQSAGGGLINTNEPALAWAMEGNYNDGTGTNKMEVYLQYVSVTNRSTRPLFVVINRTTQKTDVLNLKADVISFYPDDYTEPTTPNVRIQKNAMSLNALNAAHNELFINSATGFAGILYLGYNTAPGILQLFPTSTNGASLQLASREVIRMYSTPLGQAGSSVAIGVDDSGAALTVENSGNVALKGLVVRGKVAQTGNLFEIQNSGSTNLVSVTSDGILYLAVGLNTPQINANIIVATNGMPTNNAAFTITTNNFALDTYYTNTAQRSWVSASIGMTNVLLTEKAWVGLYLDQDGDGTWERTGINVRLQGISALAGVEQLGAFLQPSARFIFTNLGTVANSSIEPNSSQWVKQ